MKKTVLFLLLFVCFLEAGQKEAVALKAACDGRDAKSCYRLGLLMFEGKGVEGARKQGIAAAKDDFIAAYELGYANDIFDEFSSACQKGDKWGCYQLGLLYVYAPEPKKDMGKAFGIFTKNCDRKHAPSCFVASNFYASGTSVPKDAKKSFDMITKSCDMGYGEGCAELAKMYARGYNVQQDAKKEQIFAEKACLNGYFKICLEMDKFYKDETEESFKKLVKFFDVPCAHGFYEGCYVVGAIYEKPLKDDKVAKKYYKKCCELKGDVVDESVQCCSKF